MPEFGNDSRDNFSILVLADQHVRAGSTVADRDHELLGMPKGQDDVAAITVQRIDMLLPLRFDTHGPA